MKRFPRLSIRQEKTLCFEPRVLDRDQEAAIEGKSDFKYKKLLVVYLTLQLRKIRKLVKKLFHTAFRNSKLLQNFFKTSSKLLFRFPMLRGTGIYITSDNNPESEPTKC
jgi:hypothetical protein